jgi:NADH:ubiquinone oxidoreductase subunit 4 (subunit M)
MTAGAYIVAAQLFIILSISVINKNFTPGQILIYLSGTFFSAITGFICLLKIKAAENNIDLNQFHGYNYLHPKTGLLFLVACLALIGLPFTPTFIGIDILFSHIGKENELLITTTALSFLFTELAVLRIYARVFLGQHLKGNHPVAFRYS